MSEWKEKILIEIIASIESGLRPAGGVNTEDGDIPSLGGENIVQTGGVKYESLKLISKEFFDCLKRGKLSENDVLINKDGANTGKVGIYFPARFKLAAINEHLFLIRGLQNELDQYFLYYTLLSENGQKQIFNQITGSAQPGLNSNFIKYFVIDLPPLPQQRKIAHILSTIDSVIEKTQAAIDKYKSIKQGMLQDLFTRGIDIKTGKLRPRYEDAPELYKESKLGWIPNEWDSVEIKNSTHSIMSNVDKHIRENEIEVSLCNYMNVYTNRYLTNQISFSTGSVNAAEYSRFLLQLHDVIITKDSETPDDIAVPSVLFENIQNLICGYHLCILRSNDLQHLNGEFLMLQLQLPDINRQFAIRANGSTRYGLTIDSIENSFIKIPKEIKEQTEIVLRLRTTDNKLKSEESYLSKLQMLKSGLMSDLLSGKKRVKVDNEDLSKAG